jgi:predicted 3-demethylubiquinone-9 3-methyltransferase (glyoxalase superfamily)
LENSIALSESDDDAKYDYDMGNFANSTQVRSEEQAEVDDIVEAMRKQREDSLTHCEGDTDI